MTDARKRAEEALAMDYSASIAIRGVPATIRTYVDALRALLAAEPAKGACADCGGCGGLGWIPAGDEQLGGIDCNGKGTIEPAPPAGAEVREAAERLVHKIDEVNASTAYIGIWDFAAQHGIRYDGPRFVGELDALRAALSRPAAKGGDE